MSLIFLIGMPAVGKTFWANKLAVKYDLQLIDIDDFVEKKEGTSISAMFTRHGEDYFREREHEALKDIVDIYDHTNTIVACGGGTPCYMNNIELMKSAGDVVYIEASIDTLMEHLRKDVNNRPMLQHLNDVPEYLDYLLELRKSVYEQADHRLHLDKDSIDQFDEIVATCLNRQ